MTIGLMCAPLRIPTGESTISAPVASNRKPVINRRNPSSGKRRMMGLPSPNITITSDRPTNTSSAVPINSETNTCQGKMATGPLSSPA